MAIPLLVMAAMGAIAGAASNPDDRKKGALLGGLLGGGGGAALGAGGAAGSGAGALGSGGAVATNAAEIAAAQGGVNAGIIGGAQQGAQASAIQTAQQVAANTASEQAAAQQFANVGDIGLATQTSGETIAAEQAAQPTLGERFAALQDDKKFTAGAKLLTQPPPQQQAPQPVAPLVQPGITRTPVEQTLDSGEPTFIPKGLFEADVGMRKKADDEEQMLQLLRARGVI